MLSYCQICQRMFIGSYCQRMFPIGQKILIVIILFCTPLTLYWGFPDGLVVKKKPTCQVSLVVHTIKNLPGRRRQQEMQITSLDWEDPLEKGMVTHSSIFAWRIPWTEKSMKSQKVRHGWMTNTFPFAR